MSRRSVIVVLVAALILGGWWLMRYLSPAEVVKRQFGMAVTAFEAEHLIPVMLMVSRQYSDPWGQSYESVAGHLRELQSTFDDLEFEYDLDQPVVNDEAVILTLSFVLWGTVDGTRGAVFGTASDRCSATLRWREETAGWRLVATDDLDIPELRTELRASRIE